MVDDIIALNKIWRNLLSDDIKSWVIFKNGTLVICKEPDQDPRENAINLMKTMGIVVPGSSHGDFSVTHLDEMPGWVVTCHHPDILVFVGPSEVEDSDNNDMMIGLIGREKRRKDAIDLETIHVEGE